MHRVWTAPEHIDWTKVTALAPFDDLSVAGPYHDAYAKNGNNSDYAQMFCKAHEQGARILTWGRQAWDGLSCPVTEFYKWLLAYEKDGDPSSPIFNHTAVAGWARAVAECVPARGYDGVVLDIEGVTVPHALERDAITAAVCALKRELNRTLPGGMVAWTSDTGPYFDYAALTGGGCVDMWLDMAYSWCVDYETHSGLRNRANAPMPFLTGPGGVIDTYTNRFGVPLRKLGVLLPWYGCAFECAGSGVAYGGCPTTPRRAADGRTELVYGEIVHRYLPNATGPAYTNATTVTRVVNYRNATGAVHQLWYDDHGTLAAKYQAVKAAGVAGIGMWTADAGGDNATNAEALWSAVPSPHR